MALMICDGRKVQKTKRAETSSALYIQRRKSLSPVGVRYSPGAISGSVSNCAGPEKGSPNSPPRGGGAGVKALIRVIW